MNRHGLGEWLMVLLYRHIIVKRSFLFDISRPGCVHWTPQNQWRPAEQAAAYPECGCYRLVTNTRKYDHITPVLRDLHWFPIRQRIVFKLATMVYKCQHGLCPSYLAEDCILVSATRVRQHLRSAGRLELLVPRTRTVTFGPRPFAVAGPGVWNSLPPALREQTLSFNCFRRGLKTFSFR